MRVFVSLFAVIALGACGFKGNLYLPQQQSKPNSSPLLHRVGTASGTASAPAASAPRSKGTPDAPFSPTPYSQQPGSAADASAVVVEPLRD
ncbi:hypothetical protein JCM19000A_28000 [Silvimonas sp. JCM 19000]